MADNSTGLNAQYDQGSTAFGMSAGGRQYRSSGEQFPSGRGAGRAVRASDRQPGDQHPVRVQPDPGEHAACAGDVQ